MGLRLGAQPGGDSTEPKDCTWLTGHWQGSRRALVPRHEPGAAVLPDTAQLCPLRWPEAAELKIVLTLALCEVHLTKGSRRNGSTSNKVLPQLGAVSDWL